MANIAQTVNVLQAMILTDKEKMLRTPTYHVFEMFKVHQGGTYLPIELQAPDYANGGHRIPGVSASATKAASGAVHLSLVNLNPQQQVQFFCRFSDPAAAPQDVSGRVLTANKINAFNSFDEPDAVVPVTLTGAQTQQRHARAGPSCQVGCDSRVAVGRRWLALAHRSRKEDARVDVTPNPSIQMVKGGSIPRVETEFDRGERCGTFSRWFPLRVAGQWYSEVGPAVACFVVRWTTQEVASGRQLVRLTLRIDQRQPGIEVLPSRDVLVPRLEPEDQPRFFVERQWIRGLREFLSVTRPPL